MDFTELLGRYALMLAEADRTFQRMRQAYGGNIRCRPGCSDCCHAVFGLFLVEGLYLQTHFRNLARKERRAALLRGQKSEKALLSLENEVKRFCHDPGSASLVLARGRVPCPLLDTSRQCVLYPHRPLTCRIYGIPTRVRGEMRVCGRAAFGKGESYPVFDLDGAFKALHLLSRDLLEKTGRRDLEKAALLISVPKVIRTPFEEIIGESPGSPGGGSAHGV